MLLSESEKTYTNSEITIIWKLGVCLDPAKCGEGSEDFNVTARPWINVGGPGSNRVIKQADQWLSSAFSDFRNEKTGKASG
jgi:uncharacterized Fe-S cluster protein YjdI